MGSFTCSFSGTIRLKSSNEVYGNGFVEVYDEATSKWGDICKSDWDETDATILCKQLGLVGQTGLY